MKKIGAFLAAFLLTLGLVANTFMALDKKKMITQKWILTELRINKQVFSQEVLEQKQKSIGITILEFLPNGTVYLHSKTPKSRPQIQTNQWKIEGEKENKLIIQTKVEGEVTSQVFEIVKISTKKLILSLKEGRDIQIFTYRPYKP
ncbi:MAG: hypothetical protein NZ551_05085 [Microscillaceae bacterium]|nr:hypothetical protein [Microscillaceae bacterium]MDW8460569.1 hypothetical protein [Cytophagales bacterium]